MSSTSKVIAVVCSDIHLWDSAPSYRSNEPDWLTSIDNCLCELRSAAFNHKCPVIIAGDIFDRWNASPGLINFAIDRLPPDSFIIPGQHDLPNHSSERSSESAYGTLMRHPKFSHLPEGVPLNLGEMTLVGYGWGSYSHGFEIPDMTDMPYPRIAVVHKFAWKGDAGYHEAPMKDHVSALAKTLREFNSIIIGDNHHPFQVKNRGILNCGSFMIRHKGDYNAKAGSFYLMHADCSFTRVPTWKAGRDSFIEVEEDLTIVGGVQSLDAIAEALSKLSQDDDLDSLLKALLRKVKVSQEVKDLIRATFIE